MTSRTDAIRRDLRAWYRVHGRHDLPWRATRDPYRVLVSEIMLQQTQVPRVIPKYRAFLRAWPTLHALARASRTDVLRAWQGLGYNSRAIRLHELAQRTTALPSSVEGLRALPGIGPYTAGAVIIFAHDRPAPSVDVNVRRVLSRISTAPRAAPPDIGALQLALITPHPHDLHSALMDFGSLVCTARDPACASCPLRGHCRSKGPRPDEGGRTQPRFTGSVRMYRGRMLRALLDGPMTVAQLRARVDPERADGTQVRAALDALVRDGLIERQERTVRIHG